SHSEPDVNEATVTAGHSCPGTNSTPRPDSSPALMEVRGGRRLSANSTTKDHRAHEATPTQACPPLGIGASPRVRGLTVLWPNAVEQHRCAVPTQSVVEANVYSSGARSPASLRSSVPTSARRSDVMRSTGPVTLIT